MKKTNNKGFSLVELIIVIAIMAILAGAIAPALIRYIDKSRKSNDVSAAKTIKTAVETAMSNELTYELLTEQSAAAATINDADGNTINYAGKIVITQGGTAAGATTGDITITHNVAAADLGANQVADAQKEIGNNIGEKFPKVKYKKDAMEAADNTQYFSASNGDWHVYISDGGSVVVGIGDTNGNLYQLAPEVSKYYQ